jgi:NAD+ diphosphatase
LVGALRPAEAALLGYARGILHGNRHQQYRGRCGPPTRSGHAGHLRACQSQGTPRRCLAGPAQGFGRSTLAGFVDVSESLEDAVRREVAEETGVLVGTVTYMASQGWPFPSGLMIGFRATATSETVSVDGEEVLEARWFTRAELTAAAGGRLGPEDSIDRYLLLSWLGEAR